MTKKEHGIARVTNALIRDRARALRDELARPWHRGRRTPEAAIGRWLGLSLALGATALGVGLALFSALHEE